MSFRLGMMDFDEASAQTTPLEWLDGNILVDAFFFPRPSAAGIFVQHIFMKILGENNLAFRLPSALLGMPSVYLIYLLGAVLFRKYRADCRNAFRDNVEQCLYFPVGMQESYVIFFMLLASYLFKITGSPDT